MVSFSTACHSRTSLLILEIHLFVEACGIFIAFPEQISWYYRDIFLHWRLWIITVPPYILSILYRFFFLNWILSAAYFSSSHLCPDLRLLFSVKPSDNWVFFHDVSVDFIGIFFHRNFWDLYRCPAYLCSYWEWFSRLSTILVLVVSVLTNTEHKTYANYLFVYVGIHLLWK
jgi:hypothetical protein